MAAAGILERSAVWVDYDVVERVAVTALLAALSYRTVMTAVATGDYSNIVLLASEAAMAFFILIRRRTQAMSMRGQDWALACAGTLLPLLVEPDQGHPLAAESFCVALMTFGFCLHLSAKLTLRRSFGVVAANRGVRIGGPYGFIRHPMYAGYALTHVGFLLAGPNLWNFTLYAVLTAVQIARIEAEERLLKDDPAYRAFMAQVPYRLIPYVY
ncbi:MAG: isoprenylcysteine carboxylmethyltransferase family protein [Alphaproteobacteria bacterium]|nr:isoprenylcysteine carboxylmethyltransferase family protein [Alphaproteobacteria bacterium]